MRFHDVDDVFFHFIRFGYVCRAPAKKSVFGFDISEPTKNRRKSKKFSVRMKAKQISNRKVTEWDAYTRRKEGIPNSFRKEAEKASESMQISGWTITSGSISIDASGVAG